MTDSVAKEISLFGMFMEQVIHEHEKKNDASIHPSLLIKNLLYGQENATFLRDTAGNPKRAR